MSYNKERHYVILGGAGYLGIFLIYYLSDIEPNSKITIVTRNTSKEVFFRMKNVSLISDISEIVNEEIILINLAYSLEDTYSQTKRKNMLIVENIKYISKNNRILKLIHISSIVISLEDTNLFKVKVKRKNIYFYAKSLVEVELLRLSKKVNFSICIIRSGNIIGPGSPWIMSIINRLTEHLPITGDEDYYPSNATFIGNLVQIIHEFTRYNFKNKFAVYNCAEFGNISWLKWIDSINNKFGFQIKRWDIKHSDEYIPSLKQDIKYLKSLIIYTLYPQIYKGIITNNIMLRMFDLLHIKSAKRNAKSKVGQIKASKIVYYEMMEYDLIKVFINKKMVQLENVPEAIVNNLKYSFSDVIKTIDNWMELSGLLLLKKINNKNDGGIK